MRVSAEVVNCVAVGDRMGDPDVTLGWGRGGVWDGGGDGVKAVLRWSGAGEIVPGEVGVVSSGGVPFMLASLLPCSAHRSTGSVPPPCSTPS